MRSLRIASIALLSTPLLLPVSHAQQSDEMALRDIAARMQAGHSDYLANVPNFFCDEHVDSELQQQGAGRYKTSTDSIFRLRRSSTPAGERQFIESRQIKTVNKQPAKGENIQGPAIFSGAFTNAGIVVSIEMLHCYDYKLLPSARLGKSPAIAVEFSSQESALSDDSCPSSERETGRAWIDPADFHLLRVEVKIPNHKAVNGIPTLWIWQIDYAPVSFDAKQFWMPKTIVSTARANDNTAVWSFTANYSNYHKLTVTSHIITDTDESASQPR